jgi:ABC-type transport system substrate-binding protein
MALLGWQVSEYPGYLCEWFGDGNPFGYHSDRLRSACEALDSTSDLAAAQKQVYEIQSILAQDLPFIPLYSGVTYDAYRNIAYPFDSVPGGLSGVYGAPSLAIPASP